MYKKTSTKGKQLLIGISVLSSLSFVLTGCSEKSNSVEKENKMAAQMDAAIKENVQNTSDKKAGDKDLVYTSNMVIDPSNRNQRVTPDIGLSDSVDLFNNRYVYSNTKKDNGVHNVALLKESSGYVQSFSFKFNISTANIINLKASSLSENDIDIYSSKTSSLKAIDIDMYLRNKLPVDAIPVKYQSVSDGTEPVKYNSNKEVIEYTPDKDNEKEIILYYQSNIAKKRLGSNNIKIMLKIKNYNENNDLSKPFYYLDAVYDVDNNNSASKM
jgi:hypothetical protein